MEAFWCTVQGPGTLWPWHRVLPARLCLLEVPDQSCRLPLQNGAGATATPSIFPPFPPSLSPLSLWARSVRFSPCLVLIIGTFLLSHGSFPSA